jgi:Arc/MetJ-type ribon-helix-helix transcriptional regulator
MKKRTSILLDAEKYGRLERRARQRGHTVSDEIREAVDKLLDEEHPNQAWLDMARRVDETPPGPDRGPFPPVDSDEAKEEAARAIYRDSFNREPDW